MEFDYSGGRLDMLDLDDLPRLDRTVLSARYYSDYGIESLQTKRGCPLHCTYCTYPLLEGARTRMRKPARVADEFMDISARDGVDHVFIVDSVFNLPAAACKGDMQGTRGAREPHAVDELRQPSGFRRGARRPDGASRGNRHGDRLRQRLRRNPRPTAQGLPHGQDQATCVNRPRPRDQGLPFVHPRNEWRDTRACRADAGLHRGTRSVCRRAVRMGRATTRSTTPAESRRRTTSATRSTNASPGGLRRSAAGSFRNSVSVSIEKAFAVLRKYGLRGPLWQYLDRVPTG